MSDEIHIFELCRKSRAKNQVIFEAKTQAEFFLLNHPSESAVEREVNAVNNEYEGYLHDDSWRLCQLQRALSASDHDYSKFDIGSRATLWEGPKNEGIDIRDELLKFHDR